MILSMFNKILLASGIVLYAAGVSASGVQEMSVASSMWKVVASLVFIIAFIPACLWLVKRFQLTQMKLGRQSDIKILSVQSLGAKEKIMLLEVEHEKILIGVTGQTISHLKSFPVRGTSFTNELAEAQQQSASAEDKDK
ncbi:flagellar biosynthetic protein FliO [Marinomonas sp. TW1]|uniref:flagellar biosynthetic protein FliO n=1 Tax=Marinomonas sp. TW1 TaxID=1561203 RepID=UPI001E39B3E2|nr:flagellar biosynthetic protein FliO [Marinomonas sp. TW1]